MPSSPAPRVKQGAGANLAFPCTLIFLSGCAMSVYEVAWARFSTPEDLSAYNIGEMRQAAATVNDRGTRHKN